MHVASDVETTVRTLPLMLDDMDTDMDGDRGVSTQWGICLGICVPGGSVPMHAGICLPRGVSAPVHAGICLPRGCLPQCMLEYVCLGVSAPVHAGICLPEGVSVPVHAGIHTPL